LRTQFPEIAGFNNGINSDRARYNWYDHIVLVAGVSAHQFESGSEWRYFG
jgi:hypothetical protein